MDLVPLISTALGAALALSGAVVADRLRSRSEMVREDRAIRRQSYLSFLIAIDAAYGRLRNIADPAAGTQQDFHEARHVLGANDIYKVRQELLVTGSPAAVQVGEQLIRNLDLLARVVSAGSDRDTRAYHDAFHDFRDTQWQLRETIRSDLGVTGLTLAGVERLGWESRAKCRQCQTWANEDALPR